MNVSRRFGVGANGYRLRVRRLNRVRKVRRADGKKLRAQVVLARDEPPHSELASIVRLNPASRLWNYQRSTPSGIAFNEREHLHVCQWLSFSVVDTSADAASGQEFKQGLRCL